MGGDLVVDGDDGTAGRRVGPDVDRAAVRQCGDGTEINSRSLKGLQKTLTNLAY